ncbi:pilus assembly protein TadG-related protein [Desulfonatronum parangueonense]
MKFKTTQKKVNNENGAVSVITAAVLVIFIGIAALAIDIGRQTSAKNELQNAVDASALAGVIELAKNGNTNVTIKAVEAAQQNFVDKNAPTPTSVKLGRWSEWTDPKFTENSTPYNSVMVTVANYNIGSFFAPILGTTQSVSAIATAVVGPASGMERLLPIGIQEDNYYESINDPSDPEYRIITQDNFGSIGPGNWGWVDLAEAHDENASTNDRLEWIINGYPKMIFIGDEVTTDTGANLTTPARTDVHNKLTEYINNETVLFIPIICNTWSSGQSATITIRGFAPLIITGYGGQGSGFWITGRFPEDPHLVSGPIDFDATDFGVKSIVLVE